MQNHLANFLRSGGTLQELKDKYHLNIKSHGLYPNLLHFSYDQFESPMHEMIVRDARGTILDYKDNWKVIGYAFRKFFRYNEVNADKINWKNAKCLEKLDGTLILLSYYNGWNVSTTGTPDGAGPSGEMTRDHNAKILTWEPEPGITYSVPTSFAHYFWLMLKYRSPELYEKFQNNEIDSNICFSFELMGPYNPVVVKHQKPNVVLIGARNLNTLEEILPDEANQKYLFGLAEVVKEYPLTSLEDIIEVLKTLPGLEAEGYVVVDRDFNRIKCKSPGYDALHYMKDQFSEKHFLERVRVEGHHEIIAAFPQYSKEVLNLENKYKLLISRLENDFESLSHLINTERKVFAEQAKKTFCPSAMFLMLDKKCNSICEFLKNIRIENLQQLIQKI